MDSRQRADNDSAKIETNNQVPSFSYWKYVSSDLDRAQETLQLALANRRCGNPTRYKSYVNNSDAVGVVNSIEIDARLRERSYGPRQGMPRHWSEEQARQIWNSLEMDPPLYETDENLWHRAVAWLQDLIHHASVDAIDNAREDDTSSTTMHQTTWNVPTAHPLTATARTKKDVMVSLHAGIIRVILLKVFDKQRLDEMGAMYDASRKNRLMIPNTSVTVLELDLDVWNAREDTTDVTARLCSALSLLDLTNMDHLQGMDGPLHDD